MVENIPYCGTPPFPGELLSRFNTDPLLIAGLCVFAVAQLVLTRNHRARTWGAIGWIVAAVAFISPLCALSVSLFSARIAQHMLLLLAAAPMIALGLPPKLLTGRPAGRWLATIVFFLALWFWHMPTPYAATFASTGVYWSMHLTLFGSGILLWQQLLHHPAAQTADALAAGLVTSMQMALLGAVLTLASHPMFDPHFTTTALWGLSPLQDQQLGGVLMWVPGMLLFVWAAIRSLRRLWSVLEGPKPA